MKNFFKQIIRCIFFIFVAVAFVGYVINYRAAGELSFVSRDTKVYSTSDLNTHSYTLNIGDSFIALSNFGDNESIKIRFENESGKEEIGFIKLDDCNSYLFPLSTSYTSNVSKPSIVLSFDSNITFDVFLKEFVQGIENYEVIGVYMEDSDYSEKRSNLLEISAFCEEQHVPYGFVSSFTRISIDNYINIKDSGNTFESYRILPEVFDISSVANSYNFDTELSDCIFKTASFRQDNIQRYWISSINSTHSISEYGVMIMDFKQYDHVVYASISDELKGEIRDSYISIESN